MYETNPGGAGGPGLATIAEVRAAVPSQILVPSVHSFRRGLWKYGTVWSPSSGTSNLWGSIDDWATTYELMLDGISLSGTEVLKIQLGEVAGGLKTSNYQQAGTRHSGGGNALDLSTDGFIFMSAVAADLMSGVLRIVLLDPVNWIYSVTGTLSMASGSQAGFACGSVQLDGPLDRVQLMSDSANTFDAGNANVRWQ